MLSGYADAVTIKKPPWSAGAHRPRLKGFAGPWPSRQLPWLAGTVNDVTVFPGMVNAALGIPPLPYP